MTTEWLVFNNVISQVSQCTPTLHGGNSRYGVSKLNDTLSRHRITLRRLRSKEKSCITIRPPPRAATATTVNGRSRKFRFASPYGRSFSNCFDSSAPRSISISASVASVRRDLECSAPEEWQLPLIVFLLRVLRGTHCDSWFCRLCCLIAEDYGGASDKNVQPPKTPGVAGQSDGHSCPFSPVVRGEGGR